MNKEHCKVAGKIAGGIAKKVFDSAINAAVFAFVSKKVSDLLDAQSKTKKEKLRVEETPNAETTTPSEPTL